MKPAIESYQPHCGTEGADFISAWCDKCRFETWNPETDKGRKCSILSNTMLYSITDSKYPREWIYGDDGYPICTKFAEPIKYEKKRADRRTFNLFNAGVRL